VFALHTSFSGNEAFAPDEQFWKLLRPWVYKNQQKTSRMTAVIKRSCERAAAELSGLVQLL
jgi:hypothetical protein